MPKHNFIKYNDFIEHICTICGLKVFESFKNKDSFCVLLKMGERNVNIYDIPTCDEVIIKNIIE